MGTDVARLTAGLQRLRETWSETRQRLVARNQQPPPPPQQQQQQPQEQQQQEQPQQPTQSQSLAADCDGRLPDCLPVFGSVFLPTPRLLASLRFRPWAGVHLGDDYLGSLPGAEAATRRLVRAYAARGVVPLIEAELVK
jgi:hypothetical protein